MQKISNEQILQTLLSTKTREQAAAELGISSRTLYNRINAPSFEKMMQRVRNEAFQQVTTQLYDVSKLAIQTLANVMEDENAAAAVRAQAAQTVLSITERLHRLNEKKYENPFHLLQEFTAAALETED